MSSDNWPRKLSRSRYVVQRSLGRGSCGEALLCSCTGSETTVVIKQVQLSGLSEKERSEAVNEALVMQELDHLNCVKYMESFEEGGYLNMVMEHCRYGELASFIQHRAAANRLLSEDEVMFMFIQITLGLWHVHSKQILHRDLKSQNIFIAEGGILKLGDFGISRLLSSTDSMAHTAIGTPYYLSPEICQDKPYNRKSDTWALGCVLYELTTLKRAFDGHSLPALVVKILRGKYPPVSSRYSPQLRALVDALLQQNPRDRPSTDAILRLAFVRPHLARYARHVLNLQQKEELAAGKPASTAHPESPLEAAAAESSMAKSARVTTAALQIPPTAAAAGGGGVAEAGAAATAAAAAAGATAVTAATTTAPGPQPAVFAPVALESKSQACNASLSATVWHHRQGPHQQQVRPQQQQQQQQQQDGQHRQRQGSGVRGGVGIDGACGQVGAVVFGANTQATGGMRLANPLQALAAAGSTPGPAAAVATSGVSAAATTAGAAVAGAATTAEIAGAGAGAGIPAGAQAGAGAAAGAGAQSSCCQQRSAAGNAKDECHKLVESGWFRQQEAALDEMEAAFRELFGAGGGCAGHSEQQLLPPLQQEEQLTGQRTEQQRVQQQVQQGERQRHIYSGCCNQQQQGRGVVGGHSQRRRWQQKGERHEGRTPSQEASAAADTGQQGHAALSGKAAAGRSPAAAAVPAVGRAPPPAAAAAAPAPAAAAQTSSRCRKTPSHSRPTAGAPSTPPEVLAAVRQQRQRQRAQYEALQRREAEKSAVRKAARAAEVEEKVRQRAQGRRRASEEAHTAISAHRAHMKAIQPRLQRSELEELGARFSHQFAAGCGTDSGGGNDADAAGAVVCARGGGALIAVPAAVAATGETRAGEGQGECSSLNCGGGGQLAKGGRGGGGQWESQWAEEGWQHQRWDAKGGQTEQQGNDQRGDRATRQDRAPPPWRQYRAVAGQLPAGQRPRQHKGPEIEIYAPYGAVCLVTTPGGANGSDDARGQAATPEGGDRASSHPGHRDGFMHVVTLIRDVLSTSPHHLRLAAPSTTQTATISSGAAASASAAGEAEDTSSGEERDPLELPPEAAGEAEEAAYSGAHGSHAIGGSPGSMDGTLQGCQGRTGHATDATSWQQQQQQQPAGGSEATDSCSGGGGGSSSSGGGTSSSSGGGGDAQGIAVLAAKAEALQRWLEAELGHDRLVLAYRYLLQMQQRLQEAPGEGGSAAAACVGVAAGGSGTEGVVGEGAPTAAGGRLVDEGRQGAGGQQGGREEEEEEEEEEGDMQLQVLLSALLGEQVHLARHVQKLIMLEECLGSSSG